MRFYQKIHYFTLKWLLNCWSCRKGSILCGTIYIWVDRGEEDEEDDMQLKEYNYFFEEKLKEKEQYCETKLHLKIRHFFDEFNSS